MRLDWIYRPGVLASLLLAGGAGIKWLGLVFELQPDLFERLRVVASGPDRSEKAGSLEA